MSRRHFVLSVLTILSCTAPEPATRTAPDPQPADDYFSPQAEVRYDDRAYLPTIRTVQLFREGFETSPPVLELGSDDRLQLHFDDLSSEVRSLSYTIEHCDADWTGSDLVQNMYIDGAFSDFVPAPQASRGTRQAYHHYRLDFPNAFMRPRISGNYLLKVFDDGDPPVPVLTRRFMVMEQRLLIDAPVRASRDVEQRDFTQQLDLVIRHPDLPIADPFADLQVVVLQNGRWDDARTGLTPRFVHNTELVYDFPPEALFNGGNEWRVLDARSLRYAPPGVARIATDQPLAELFLAPDLKRNIRMHVPQGDRNGAFLVRTDDGYDPTTEADYVWVYWQLPFGAHLSGGDVFLYGGFTDFQCRREYRCAWEETGQRYVLRALVKQGIIDYLYAFLPDGATAPDLGALEGAHYATENDYTVLVYLMDHSLRAQRLVGVRVVGSRP